MKDLYFMNDGNPTRIGEDTINFQKFRAMTSKIKAIRVSQQSHFPQTVDDGTAPSPAALRAGRAVV